MFDGDADSMIVSHPDRCSLVASSPPVPTISSPTAGLLAAYPACCVKPDSKIFRLRAFTAFDHDLQGWSGIQAGRAAAIAVEAGAISEDERQRWLEQLRVEEAAGRFTAGLTWFFVWGTVPQDPI